MIKNIEHAIMQDKYKIVRNLNMIDYPIESFLCDFYAFLY
jgi:hypothetical protein